MSLVRGANLRSTVNRKLQVDGGKLGEDFTIGADKAGITVHGIGIVRSENRDTTFINDGETVHFQCPFRVKISDRILMARINPILHTYGLVQDIRVYDSSDGWVAPTFRFEAEQDLDVQNIDWFIKLYITE